MYQSGGFSARFQYAWQRIQAELRYSPHRKFLLTMAGLLLFYLIAALVRPFIRNGLLATLETLEFVISLLLFIMALTVHEFSHAYVAVALGDPTPRYMGRLSLNPLRHIDWFGLLAILIIKIGWAKPVPFNPNNLRQPERDSMLIALAGPASNFALFLVGLFLCRLSLIFEIPQLLRLLCFAFAQINLILFYFNLIPIPPLDGSKILAYFLPTEGKILLQRLEQLQLFVMIFFLSFGGGTMLHRLCESTFQFFGQLIGMN
jgi:Zn-dependent protease